jgi:hypothetical protein
MAFFDGCSEGNDTPYRERPLSSSLPPAMMESSCLPAMKYKLKMASGTVARMMPSAPSLIPNGSPVPSPLRRSST